MTISTLFYLGDELPVQLSQSALWAELSFKSQHENEHRSFATVFERRFCHVLGSCLGCLIFLHFFMLGIIFFTILR